MAVSNPANLITPAGSGLDLTPSSSGLSVSVTSTSGQIPGARLIYDGTNVVWYNPKKHIQLAEDWITGGNTGNNGWNNASSGGGTSTINASPTSITPGQLILSTGTGTTDSGAIRLGATNIAPYVQGSGAMYSTWNCILSALSDGTNTYTVRMGWGDTNSVTSPNNGYWFEYTHGTNSGNWVIKQAGSGTPSSGNTNTPATATLQNFSIVVNAAGTSTSFFIDGVEVVGSPLTSNFPVKGCAPYLTIIKSAGGTARTLSIDYFYAFINLTSART